MIFESIGLSITENGAIVLGGTDVTAYSFTEPLIEIENVPLREFLIKNELNVLDNTIYEGALFYCLKTNSLYLNVANWYRFKNNLKVTSSKYMTVILSRVDIVVSEDKPDNAFAKYTILDNIWLTCPYAKHENSTDYNYTSGTQGDKIREYGFGHSRFIHATFKSFAISAIELLRYNVEGTSAYLPNREHSVKTIFYISKVGEGLYINLLEDAHSYGRDTPLLEKFVSNDKENIVRLYGYHIIRGNASGINISLDSDGSNFKYYHTQCIVAERDDGSTYFIGGRCNTHNNIKFYVKESRYTSIYRSDNYESLHELLEEHEKSENKFAMQRLFVPDYYSDKECKNLIGINCPMISYTLKSPNVVRFFDQENIPDRIYQKESAYLSLEYDDYGYDIFRINEVTDFRVVQVHNDIVYLPQTYSTVMINPYNPEDTYSYEKRVCHYHNNKKLWLANSDLHLSTIFNKVAVYGDVNAQNNSFIYNDTPHHGIVSDTNPSTAIASTNSENGLVMADGPNNIRIAENSSMGPTFDIQYLNYTATETGNILPQTSNPPLKRSDIRYYTNVSYVCFYKKIP